MEPNSHHAMVITPSPPKTFRVFLRNLWRLKLSADWTSLDIHQTVLRIIARVSGRAFVGLPLCRDEDWLKISVLFTVDAMKSIREFRSISGFARPFKAFFYQPAKVLDNHRKLAKARLTPVIEARLAEEEAAKKAGRPPIDYHDTLQWFRDVVRPEHKTPEAIAELQLGLSMVAIHTTAMSLTTVVLDLAAHPEYIQPLREEIEAVIKEDGGAVQKMTLRKMRKMDSFIKESFRGRVGLRRWPCKSPEMRASYIFHAHRGPDYFAVSFTRKVMKSFTLSDGTFLPKGAVVAAPRTMFDLDPEFIEDPEVFDGFRSYKKHLASGGAGQFDKSQSVTTSPSYVTFGHGTHACPGRFFALDELKLLLCHLLLQYDIMFGEGNPLLPFTAGESIRPNPAQKLSLKKIQTQKKFDFL